MDSVLVRYGEIALKGGNRAIFENQLVHNIKDCLNKNSITFASVDRYRGRIIVKTSEDASILRTVFGIVSISPAQKCSDLAELKSVAEPMIKHFKVFRVSSQRLDKTFPLTSKQIEQELGAFVVEKTNAKVDLKNYRQELGVEIINGLAYVFTERIAGFGGLPLGTEGKVITLLHDKKSLLATWLIMRRGALPIICYTKKPNTSLIEKYHHGFLPQLIKINEVPDMDAIAEQNKVEVMITGDTLADFKPQNTKLATFHPIIAYTEEELDGLYDKIR